MLGLLPFLERPGGNSIARAAPQTETDRGDLDGPYFRPPTMGTLRVVGSGYLEGDEYDVLGSCAERQTVSAGDDPPRPIGEREWCREFTLPLSEDYSSIVEQDFPIQALGAAVEAVAVRMEEVGSYTSTAGHIQDAKMGKRGRPVDI